MTKEEVQLTENLTGVIYYWPSEGYDQLTVKDFFIHYKGEDITVDLENLITKLSFLNKVKISFENVEQLILNQL